MVTPERQHFNSVVIAPAGFCCTKKRKSELSTSLVTAKKLFVLPESIKKCENSSHSQEVQGFQLLQVINLLVILVLATHVFWLNDVVSARGVHFYS